MLWERKRPKLCPYCLEVVTFTETLDKRNITYQCPACNQNVPPDYVQSYDKRPVIMHAVGFRNHGKTVYFSALSYAIQTKLAQVWTGFTYSAPDDASLRNLRDNYEMLRRGQLPPPNQQAFQHPTIVQLYNIPKHGRRTVLFYDTAGEAFVNAAGIQEYAHFVRRASTVVFLVSIADLRNPAMEMHALLNNYINSMINMDAATRDQNLLVVYTKADLLAERFRGSSFDFGAYLGEGDWEALRDMDGYLCRMREGSAQLRDFTIDKLKAEGFVNLADEHFRSVHFCAVSSLGAAPGGDVMGVAPVPRRVLDPLLWVLTLPARYQRGSRAGSRTGSTIPTREQGSGNRRASSQQSRERMEETKSITVKLFFLAVVVATACYALYVSGILQFIVNILTQIFQFLVSIFEFLLYCLELIFKFIYAFFKFIVFIFQLIIEICRELTALFRFL